ncbi:pol [Symbiodinium natans]|uniref:Pol protein n=1 Tax=Symbiodinium natans TaxID=878477 RepID=A0A812I550_9DINO|nr:pol [Symbiodinium natans]
MLPPSPALNFAVAMDPLRRYLREDDAGLPLTPRGLEGIERLERLMKKAKRPRVLPCPMSTQRLQDLVVSSWRIVARLAWGERACRCAHLKTWLPLAYHAESLTIPAGAACAAAMPTEVPRAVWVYPRGDVHRSRESCATAG